MPTPPPVASDSVTDPAAACFFNALLRESRNWRLGTEAGEQVAILPVTDAELHLPLAHRSASGECRFRWPVIRVRGTERMAIDFESALDAVLATPALVGTPDSDAIEAFRQRVLESRANTRSSLSGRTDLPHIQQGEFTFAEAEQALLVGHAFHPAPKSRSPFTDAEARRYCPEHRARFALGWWAVAPAYGAGASSRATGAAGLIASLLPERLRDRLPPEFMPLPMHPWQANVLRKRDDIRRLERAGALVRLGEGEPGWLPTSSHRSLYGPGAPWMVKGSLSARLTNSLRLLSLKEVERGLKLDSWTCNRDLGQRFPGFTLLQEPAWLGWRLDDGDVDPASLVVLRENPLQDRPEAETAVLATLTQQPLTGGDVSPLAARIRSVAQRSGTPLDTTAREWFAAFCERVLTPLFGLAVEDGIVLLAHQQNIVLRLDDGWPVGMYYRDCQGSGVSDRFLERHPPAGDPPENHWSRETVRRYFLYYVMVNTTFAVTSAMAADGLVDEAALLDVLRAHLRKLWTRLDGDHDCLEQALHAPRLQAKGNFFCYLSGVNEATLANPARLYLPLDNPLAGEQRTPVTAMQPEGASA